MNECRNGTHESYHKDKDRLMAEILPLEWV
jgi:hypothetical protein